MSLRFDCIDDNFWYVLYIIKCLFTLYIYFLIKKNHAAKEFFDSSSGAEQ